MQVILMYIYIIRRTYDFVFTPVYDYDESKRSIGFENIEKAISFIEEHLEQNKTASFHNAPDDYIVVEGRKIKLKAIEYASKGCC